MRQLLFAVALAALAQGCGCDGGAGDGGLPDAADTGIYDPEIIFFRPPADETAPSFGDVPFPSDLYLDSDGTIFDEIPGLGRVMAANDATVSAALAPLRGFGRTTASYFFVSGGDVEIPTLPSSAAASLGSDGSVFLANVDPASPGYGERVPVLTRWQPTIGAIAVLPKPGVVLRAATRYAAVVTIGVTYFPCLPFSQDAELARIFALPAADRATRAEVLYGEAADALVATGNLTMTSLVSGIAVFTTMDAAPDMVAVATAVADPAVYPDPQFLSDPVAIAPFKPFVSGATGPSPTLDEWLGAPDVDPATGFDILGEDNPGGQAHDAIGAVLTGAFTALRFIDPDTGHMMPDDGSGPPDPLGTWLVPVTFVFPPGPPPPNGWPVVINGHGLGNSRRSVLAIANELCRRGFAVVAIDDVLHGTRNSAVADDVNVWPGTYTGPDGFADTHPSTVQFDFFAYFSDGIAMRDNFRQTIADHLSLIRLLESPGLDLSAASAALGGVTPVLDPTNLFYTGGSLGGIMGSMIGVYAPDLRGVSLVVPGGGFVHLLASNSAGFQALLVGVLQVIFGAIGAEPFDSFNVVSNLIATGFEPADPLGHVEHLVRDPLPLGPGGAATPRNVLVSYAIDDETLPNRATHALIWAAGLTLATPAIDPADDFDYAFPAAAAPFAANVTGPGGDATAAAVQYSPSTHAMVYDRWSTRAYEPGAPFDGQPDRFPVIAAPITIEMPIYEMNDAIAHFFETGLDGAMPEVIVTVPPVADYDADGVPDVDEMTAGTDPYDPASN